MKDRSATWGDITPEKALELLKMNTANRTIKQRTVAKYVEDMKTGNWKENGVPFVIGDDGVIKDGQHRLTAIVKAGVTLHNQLIVTIPAEEANGYDIGSQRSFRDVALLEGYTDNPLYRCNTLVAGFNFARNVDVNNRKQASKIETLNQMVKYEEELYWVYRALCSNAVKRISTAGVVAAVINAHLNGYPHDKLERFCEVLTKGISLRQNEITIITLRNFFLNFASKAGRDAIKEAYYRTQKALYNYNKDEVIIRSLTSCKEYYKFPEEEIR